MIRKTRGGNYREGQGEDVICVNDKKSEGMVSRNVGEDKKQVLKDVWVGEGLINTEPIRVKGKVVKVQRVQFHLKADVPTGILGST